MSPPLTGKQSRFLRALAHDRKPVVQIGHAGLTKPVLAAIEQALETHELIKVRVQADTGGEVRALVPELESALKANVAQVIGHTVLLYRRHKKEPKIELPKDKPARKAKTKAE
ncbi:MAG: ribosome assembly RNA-binding protein YhbY [Polyangiaceae bacterium]